MSIYGVFWFLHINSHYLWVTCYFAPYSLPFSTCPFRWSHPCFPSFLLCSYLASETLPYPLPVTGPTSVWLTCWSLTQESRPGLSQPTPLGFPLCIGVQIHPRHLLSTYGAVDGATSSTLEEGLGLGRQISKSVYLSFSPQPGIEPRISGGKVERSTARLERPPYASSKQ